MPALLFENTFTKSVRKFIKNNDERSKAVKKALRIFQENPQYRSLHTEKLSGADIWTIRIDRGNRLFFTWADKNNTAIFFFIGPHDSYRKINK